MKEKKVVVKAKREKRVGKSGNDFINNEELLAEIITCKAAGNVLSDKLALMLQKMCKKYSCSSNWYSYSWREDAEHAALMNLVQNWMKFDETKYSNPFAWVTTCMYRIFLQYWGHEKTQQQIRDQLLIDQGANPSWGYDSEFNKKE